MRVRHSEKRKNRNATETQRQKSEKRNGRITTETMQRGLRRLGAARDAEEQELWFLFVGEAEVPGVFFVYVGK